MRPPSASMHIRPTVALADYDFLRSTCEILLRSPTLNYPAINAAFQALDAAHERLQAAHQRLLDGLDSVVH